MRRLRWVAIPAGALLLAAAVVTGVGYALPLAHTATVSVELPAAPEEVWGLIRDLEGTASWRPGVRRVSRVAGAAGEVWEEHNQFGPIRYRVEAEEPPVRLVLRIVDNPDFGGTWTYELAPAGSGTRLSITENGEIYSPLFRFISRFVMGYDGTMREYARALQRRLS